MAVLKHGINGPFSGKVGSIIGVVKDGKQQIKGQHKDRTTKISDKEKHNRKRFATAQKWLLPVVDYVRQGFGIEGKTTTSFIRAVGNILKTALIDEENDLRVDPKLVLMSKGILQLPENIRARITEGKFLEVTWDAILPHQSGHDHQAFIVAYAPDSNFATGTCRGALGKTGIEIIELIEEPARVYHIYFAMVSGDRLHYSESIYLGELSLS